MMFAWLSSWLSSWKSDSEAPRRSSRQDVTFKPTLETLEAREVPSANPLDGLLGQLTPGTRSQFEVAKS